MPGEAVLDALGGIEKVVRDHRVVAERERQLAPAVVAALRETGVVRLYGPTSRGGYGADPVTVSRVTEQLAEWDPAAAWFVMVSNAVRVGAKAFPPALFERLWGDDIDTIVAGSGNSGLSGELEGGALVSGRIGFVSGCHHADWLLAPFSIDGSMRTVFIPLTAVTIEDNWHVTGLRGTGSNDVTLDRVFLSDDQMMVPGAPGNGNEFCADAVFRCPGRIVFATYVPVAFVLARQALELLTDLAREKTPYATVNKLANRSVAQIKYGKGLALYRSAYNYYYDTMAEAWERASVAGRAASDDEKADLYLAGVHAVQTCADVVRLVADVAGTSAIYLDSPLEAIVRDMEVLRHHGFANEQRFGSVSQVKWGVPLDYPLMLR